VGKRTGRVIPRTAACGRVGDSPPAQQCTDSGRPPPPPGAPCPTPDHPPPPRYGEANAVCFFDVVLMAFSIGGWHVEKYPQNGRSLPHWRPPERPKTIH